jgi:hypothetical protein
MSELQARNLRDNQIRKQERRRFLLKAIPFGTFITLWILFLPKIQQFFGIIN